MPNPARKRKPPALDLLVAFPRAMEGDLRAWEACRRLLGHEARLFGLYDGPPDDEGEIPLSALVRDENGLTVLDRYRQRYRPDGPA
jgi:hypothetical protein